ncbi:MAG: NAD-dependent epimerase/dehydratase family protein [bacterium]
MKALITGVAGFIGSSLAERLLLQGHQVVGLDAFLPYYGRKIKEANLAALRANKNFAFHETDLLIAPLHRFVDGCEVVFHEAAQAGVRASWGESFEIYTQNNILATQKLLESLKGRPVKLIYASSSSVYGETNKFPMEESDLPQPISPYGVSKLAAEHLCKLYHAAYKVHTVALRYFTVYGPRQRPDMAFHRFIRALLDGESVTVYGDGRQTRDFTFIDDAVEANLLAAERGQPGSVYNIGGGSRVSIHEVLKLLKELTGSSSNVVFSERQRGDVTHTYASTARARKDLGFSPKVELREGLRRETEWVRNNLALLKESS